VGWGVRKERSGTETDDWATSSSEGKAGEVTEFGDYTVRVSLQDDRLEAV
jgi:hypothetical protein